ncbi:hypothetical protein C2W62_21170 [Candidatus Entotheonella serta]|nr:hypothetical protein C2W62_21170 [Candidatus Entotheonella serta]
MGAGIGDLGFDPGVLARVVLDGDQRIEMREVAQQGLRTAATAPFKNRACVNRRKERRELRVLDGVHVDRQCTRGASHSGQKAVKAWPSGRAWQSQCGLLLSAERM